MVCKQIDLYGHRAQEESTLVWVSSSSMTQWLESLLPIPLGVTPEAQPLAHMVILFGVVLIHTESNETIMCIDRGLHFVL